MWKFLEPVFLWSFRIVLLGWVVYVALVKPHVNPISTSKEQATMINHFTIKTTFGGPKILIPKEVK